MHVTVLEGEDFGVRNASYSCFVVEKCQFSGMRKDRTDPGWACVVNDLGAAVDL